MKTDTSEKGLEALIVDHMTAGGGWIAGRAEDYDRSYAIDHSPGALLFFFTTRDKLRTTDPLTHEWRDGNGRAVRLN